LFADSIKVPFKQAKRVSKEAINIGIIYKTDICKNNDSEVRYFIKLAYNGAAYHGWQSQLNAHSVQDELEKCLSLKLKQPIRLSGCGRTDTGVHAREFFAHFDLIVPFFGIESTVFKDNLNIFLPADIVVSEIFEVNPAAHARFDALLRTYEYRISRHKNPFLLQQAYYVFGELDLSSIRDATSLLFEYTDFSCFSKLHSNAKTNDCLIKEAIWIETDEELIFRISANRFLRNMVRAITGTLIELGQGKLSVSEFRKVIESKDRAKAGYSVPAHALFLVEVQYPTELIGKGYRN
jgi:tRNA pseudouridine38-40 synthase